MISQRPTMITTENSDKMLNRVVAQFELGFWDEVASKQLKAHNNAIVFAKLYQVAPIQPLEST